MGNIISSIKRTFLRASVSASSEPLPRTVPDFVERRKVAPPTSPIPAHVPTLRQPASLLMPCGRCLDARDEAVLPQDVRDKLNNTVDDSLGYTANLLVGLTEQYLPDAQPRLKNAIAKFDLDTAIKCPSLSGEVIDARHMGYFTTLDRLGHIASLDYSQVLTALKNRHSSAVSST